MNVLFCDVRYHTTLHECIVLWCNVSHHPSWMYCFVIKVSQFDLSVTWKIASQLPLTKHTLWHLWTQFAENYPSDPFFPQREKVTSGSSSIIATCLGRKGKDSAHPIDVPMMCSDATHRRLSSEQCAPCWARAHPPLTPHHSWVREASWWVGGEYNACMHI